MSEVPILSVEAEVRFVDEGRRSRATPFRTGYRPNHWISGVTGGASIGEVTFLDREEARPGETVWARICFLSCGGLAEVLSAGSEWEIREGPTLVARGRVLRVVTDCAAGSDKSGAL